ncbi:hypothetical protein DFG55_12250 [Xanthomonas campestris pv. campestris]|nr:hypothetical protein DFG55_12250 [Xanthomonas campestris pv. campestris]QCX72419.1 hypothetical protein DFG54_18170 [Xanthomonas campestris pv. campestris]
MRSGCADAPPPRAVCCLLCAVCCVLCAVCCLLSAVCCVLCAVCCLLLAACCLQDRRASPRACATPAVPAGSVVNSHDSACVRFRITAGLMQVSLGNLQSAVIARSDATRHASKPSQAKRAHRCHASDAWRGVVH